MSAWTLAAAAVLTGMTLGAGHQEAAVATVQGAPAPAIEIAAQRRVSVDFSHAPASEVLKWLADNGANFITADSEIPKDAAVTVSIKDAPIDEVVDALADALGGHWERRGSIRVFRKGVGFRMYGGEGIAMPGEMWKAEDMARLKSFTGQHDAKFWTTPDGKKLREELKALPKMGDFKMPEVRVWETAPDGMKLREEMKAIPEIREWAQGDMEKAMKAQERAWAESEGAMKISGKAMDEARKEIEKAHKEHPEMFREGDAREFYFAPGGKDYVFRMDGKAPVFGKSLRPGTTFMFDSGRDITKLFNSLTPDQREMNRRQGYLRMRDLTPSQRSILGVSGKAKGWTIRVSKDGDDLTIKSDD
ncbi:MAG: hypothetical protein QOJ65_839 [Fimbriimonadaceae bacterium]|jgi:hypothetical protein|nr:hypothetical protein [Fimbriimonadaceae bacterium]